ncbi:unnamed protein product, partial [Prorocentrum cordatum]
MPSVLQFGLLCHTLTARMRLISWNPMPLQDCDRRIEISRELQHVDAVLLSGTQTKTIDAYDTHSTTEFLMLKFGWHHCNKNTTGSKSCGTEIWHSRRWFRKSHIVKVCQTPAAIRGRVGAVRVKSSQFDYTFIAAHFPPRAPRRTTATKHEVIVDKITAHLRDVLASLPNRTCVFIGADLNDGLKRDISTVDENATIGAFASGQQHYAGGAFHALLKDYALCATNTRHRHNIACRLTKRLRAFPSQRLLDHMMLYIDVDCSLTYDKPKTLPQWDFARIFPASHDERYRWWAKQLRDDIERDLTNLMHEYGH